MNTLGSIRKSPKFHCPNLARLGLFHLDGVQPQQPQAEPIGAFARLQERSMGKDTTIGHWEIAGVESPRRCPPIRTAFRRRLFRNLNSAPAVPCFATSPIPAPRY